LQPGSEEIIVGGMATKRKVDPKMIEKNVRAILKRGKGIHAKRVLSIANAVTGVITAGALAVHAIGCGLAAAKALVKKHAIKQVDRLVGNAKVVVDSFFALWVPYVLADRPKVVVNLDWTDFDDDGHTMLVASVQTSHGRSTPLLWKTVHKSALKKKRNQYEDDLLLKLCRLVPGHVKVTIVADRGFCDTKLYHLLTETQARALGFTQVKPGAVTFLHQAGGALNLNPHPHSIIPDGVFVCEPEQPALFLELGPPTQREVEVVLATIVRRVGRLLERAAPARECDLDAGLEDAFAEAQARAVALRLEPASAEPNNPPPAQPLCSRREGFSLHAGVTVTVAADDKQGRLRLFRYGARPAFSSSYLSLLPDGRVRYQLRHTAGPGREGAIVLEPTELLRRLASTLPRPYQHRTVYHGIFAPAANRRAEVSPAAPRSSRPRCFPTATGAPLVPLARSYTLEIDHARAAPSTPGAQNPGPGLDAQALARFCAPPPRPPGGRLPWAELIARTFPDALECPKCGGTLSVIAFITELAVVQKILAHLGLPAGTPPLTPARLPKELGFDFEADHHRGTETDEAEPASLPRGRGPPPPRPSCP
jgi:hypothetical protein